MTEKRFTLSTTEFDDTLSFYDAEYDCETRMGTEYVLNSVETTLNYLNDENEQLKQTIQDMRIRFVRKYDYEFDDIVDELD